MTSLATPKQKNPCHEGHDIHNLGRPFLSHHYYKLNLSGLCLGVQKKIFNEIMHFHLVS